MKIGDSVVSNGSGGARRIRRVPAYLVLDHSAALAGTAMVSLNGGLQSLRQQVASSVSGVAIYLALIAFADSVVHHVLTPANQFAPPRYDAAGDCMFGAALRVLRDALDLDRLPEDSRPLVFLLLGGQPTDEWEPEGRWCRQAAQAHEINTIGLALSANADQTVKAVANRAFALSSAEPGTIASYIRWMGHVMELAARAAANSAGGPTQMPYPPQGVVACS